MIDAVPAQSGPGPQRPGRPARTPHSTGLLATLLIVAVPLLLHLGARDVETDEAIYSYAVERILETGEWLTPRGSPHDGPFLEKPPLKFWMVAAGMRAGLLPLDETGLRLLDAIFGIAAGVYVYLIGCRLAGPLCGAAAALTLVTFGPLVTDHGLRGNNMEAALVLAYCGAIHHGIRWLDAGQRGRREAFAVAGFFVLGFMTKFVAMLFFPIVLVASALWREQGYARLRARLHEWWLPGGLAALAIVPWFAYQSVVHGASFWEVILGVHVLQRFAGTLEPTHLAPWHHYFTSLAAVVARSGVAVLCAAGLVRLVIAARRGTPMAARPVLLWATVPLVLMSAGTSKLLHYAYPFLPPYALACGLAAAWIAQFAAGRSGVLSPAVRAVRIVLVAAAAIYAVLAVATAWSGPILLERGGLLLLRNTSVWRPAVLAAVLLLVAAYGRSWPRLVLGGALAFLLPISAYGDQLQQFGRPNHPIRATRDCLRQQQPGARGSGVVSASGNILHHAFFFYLRHTGPVVVAEQFDLDATRARLTDPAPTPVIVSLQDYQAMAGSLPPEVTAAQYHEGVVGLFPGPFAPCAAAVIQAGGKAVTSSTLAAPLP